MARYSTSDILTRDDIDTFVAKLKATVKAAEAASELRELAERLTGTFGDSSGSRRTASAATTKTKGRGRRTRQAAIDPQVVYAVIQNAKEGLSVSEIASQVKEDKQRVAVALRKLRDEKKAKLKGEKRLARWYPA